MGNSVALTIRQWKAVFWLYLRESMAYPATFFIWILTDTITCFLLPLIISKASNGGAIGGLSHPQVYVYYCTTLLLNSFIVCHFMWEVGQEIKDGQFSAHIVRPIGYLGATMMRNLSWRIVRPVVALPLVGFFILVYRQDLVGAHVYCGPQFWLATIGGHLLSYVTVMCLTNLALFLQEASGLFELYYVPMLLLSGQIFPISVMPAWAGFVAHNLPFYYTTGFAADLAVGRVPPNDAWWQIGIQVIWIIVSILLWRTGFRAGLRRYTGVGM